MRKANTQIRITNYQNALFYLKKAKTNLSKTDDYYVPEKFKDRELFLLNSKLLKCYVEMYKSNLMQYTQQSLEETVKICEDQTDPVSRKKCFEVLQKILSVSENRAYHSNVKTYLALEEKLLHKYPAFALRYKTVTKEIKKSQEFLETLDKITHYKGGQL